MDRSDDRIRQEADSYALAQAFRQLLCLLADKGILTAGDVGAVFHYVEDKMSIRKAEEMARNLKDWGPEKFQRETGCTAADIKYLHARDSARQRLDNEYHGLALWYSHNKPKTIRSKLMAFLTRN